MKKLLILFFVFCASFSQSNAQEKTITGTITDKETNEPVMGAIIQVKDTKVETVSDRMGKYSITVPEDGKILVFSHEDMMTQEVPIEGQSTIDIGMLTTGGDLYTLSLEELLNMEVVSASNKGEKLSEAPATMIVITKDDIKKRGYNDVSEIYEDLPGMQMVRPYGDTYYKNYWRGYRNTIGSPYLVMVDGVILNSLYFGITTPMAALAISNIEKIEVVYGPVSSVYGANAFMGVINIITVSDKEADGSYVNAKISTSDLNYSFADLNYFYRQGDFRVSITGHIENGDLDDRIDNNSFYWLRDEHYANEQLWGDYLNNPMISQKKFSSYIQNQSIDIRVYAGGTEIAAQHNNLNTGYGTVYPGDKTTSNCVWPRVMSNLYARHKRDLTDNIKSVTLLRYRTDGIDNSAYDIEAWNSTNDGNTTAEVGGLFLAPGESTRVLSYTSWYTKSWSASFFQDFDVRITDQIGLNTGIKYEYKDLQKAYNLNHTDLIAPELVDASQSDRYAPPSPGVYEYQNRIIWEDHGAYLQAQYKIIDGHKINAGMRIDHNSYYGTSTNFRANYVGQIEHFTVKSLYGQAFKEPTARLLFGSWNGSGSDPNLDPEDSQTAELSVNYAKGDISTLISGYWVNNTNTLITTPTGAKNLGTRTVIGLDYHIQAMIPISFVKSMKVWGYYSGIFMAEEEEFEDGVATGKKIDIGDLAKHNFYFGFSSEIISDLNLTLYGRSISERETVATNPVGSVGSYFTLDGNLSFDNVFVKGLGVGVRMTNILDQQYFHPGNREGNSGMTPGSWDGKAWNGSNGWFNSLLPQPRRFTTFYVSLDF